MKRSTSHAPLSPISTARIRLPQRQQPRPRKSRALPISNCRFFNNWQLTIGNFVMETVLDSLAIQKLLPHRYPFLLVDRIVELVPRERIVGIKQVSINEPFFQGHFPGAPVMPGVLVVEALAQVGAVLALREIEDRDQKLVLFTGIKEARFRRPVV